MRARKFPFLIPFLVLILSAAAPPGLWLLGEEQLHGRGLLAPRSPAGSEPGPPPDTTPPTLSSVDALCGQGGLWQGGSALSDEDAEFKYRYGYGTKLSTILMGAWSSWSGSFAPGFGLWMNKTHQMQQMEYFKFEMVARDTALNESATYSGNFQSITGDCP